MSPDLTPKQEKALKELRGNIRSLPRAFKLKVNTDGALVAIKDGVSEKEFSYVLHEEFAKNSATSYQKS